MTEPTYIGLDTATVTGMAIYSPHRNLALVHQVKGSPPEQLREILRLLVNQTHLIFAMEKLHNFRNANVTRSLLERYGYIRWVLQDLAYPVVEVSPLMARSFLGMKTKQDVFMGMKERYTGPIFTSNHSDALAVAMYAAHMDLYLLEPVIPEIRGMK